jgi:hypothetical protein
MTWVVVTTYRRRVSLSSGEARTGGLVMSVLSLSSALCASSVQGKELDFFSNLYKGSPRPLAMPHSAEGYEIAHEPLNIIDVPDLAHFGNDQNIVGVCLDAALSDDVPQELAPGDPEGAFLWI